MNEKPSVLIVSSSNTKPSSIIKLLTKDKTSVLKPGENGEISYAWKLDTKYYTTEVNLTAIDNNYLRSQEFNESVEALIIHMDTNKETGLEDLIVWEDVEKDCDPEVKLLVANYCNVDTKITIEKALEWCLKHGYEFVELYPTVSKKGNEDEIIEEKVGVDRIIEALEAHTWPNLVMKTKLKLGSQMPGIENGVEGGENLEYIKTQMVEECMKFVDTFEEYLPNDGLDDFSELLAEVNMMRESLKDMPPNQKKLCAEKMTKAFWRAIGGDEEEISDI